MATPQAKQSFTARQIGFWLGIVLFVVTLLVMSATMPPEKALIGRMAAVAVLMATWWITEAVPLAATSLLPLVLFPALAIKPGKDVAPIYINDVIFLYIGGFLIALAMERWNLHKRIALTIIRIIGGGPSRLVLSFMIATAFISMWISNTATAIMMFAIGLAIITQQEAAFGKERTANLSVALLLAIAYAASMGGIATLIGTPPNLAMKRIFSIFYPEAEPINFGQWMVMGLPISILMLAAIWFILTQVMFKSPSDLRLSTDVIQKELAALGRVTYEEIVVLIIFAATAFLWVFRADMNIGSLTIPGWAGMWPNGKLYEEGTVGIAMVLLLFFVPVRNAEARAGGARSILDLDVFKKLPWDIVLLFGGGFALAVGFKDTGLAAHIGGGFEGLKGMPTILVILGVCLVMTFLTELTSNAATTEMALPILAAMSGTMGVHPLMLMIPATLSASCAFMLPAATPPNAIVFGSGRIRVAQMAKAGLVINFIGVVVVTLVFYFVGQWVFNIQPGVMPDWAQPAATAPAK